MFFLGFIYSYYFHKDSQKNFEVTIFKDVSYKEHNIYYLYIWNSGKTTIYKEDIINESGAMEVYFDNGTYVEYAKITDITSDFFSTKLSQNHNNLKIEFDLLRPDEGFTLLLKMVRPSVTYWQFQIKHRKDFLNFPRTIKARGKNSNLNLFNNIFGYFTLTGWVGTSLFVGEIDFLNFNGYYEVFINATTFVIIFFLIYMTPLLFQRMKAPRPPKELKLHYIEKNKKTKIHI